MLIIIYDISQKCWLKWQGINHVYIYSLRHPISRSDFFTFLYTIMHDLSTFKYTVFLKPGDAFLSRCHLLFFVLSDLVFPRLALGHSQFLIFHIFFNKFEYPFDNLHSTLPGHCAKQLLTVRSMYGNGLFWGIQGNARPDKARQCVALRQLDKTRWMSLFKKQNDDVSA